MARFATTISIAGIDWSGCRALIQDGMEFVDPVKGTVDWAFDSTPNEQYFDTQFRGTQFGLELGSQEGATLITKVNETLHAITAQRKFPVLYTDEQYILNIVAQRDFTQQWYKYGPFSEGYLKGVTFRFVVTNIVSVALSS